MASGQPIGFTLTASGVSGTVVDGVLTSDLPPGGDVVWTVDPASGCVVTGAAGAQVLTCQVGTLDPGAAFAVHVSSATTTNSCASYTDVGVLSSDNAPTVSAQDVTRVICVLPVQTSATPPPVAPQSQPPLASTGAGPLSAELTVALALVAGGALVLAFTRRLEPRRRH